MKRTELPSAESPTFHPEATNTTIDADSPNSALPSPVSDVDDTWEEQQLQLQELQQAKQEQEHEEKVNVIMEQEEEFKKQVEQQKIVDEDQKMELKPSCSQASLLDTFDQLPDNIQTYFMFQLLKRSPRPALRIANSTIMQVLKTDLITQLPECLSIHILSFLDVKSLCRATGVNRAWQSLVSNDELWRLKMMECDFHPSAEESSTTYKRIVKRHTLMRRNWQHNRFHKMQLQGHENNVVTCLQFDDDKIITGSDDQSINVYDIRTGQRRRVLKGHDGGVWALQYVGNTLVTGSTDRTIRVWDIDAGVCRFVLRGHSSTVRCLKIVMPMPMENGLLEPSEPLIVSGSRDTTIRVWRLPDISQPPSDDDEDGAKFLKYTLMEHEHSVRDLATYGNILVSGSYDNNVIVWDLHTGRRLHTLDGHQMKVYSVVIDAKRRQCISGSLDASVRIWGLDDGQCKNILQGKIGPCIKSSFTHPL